MNPKKTLRCGIYTRKSSEEGLEQEFNSVHAQREACEAYIKSQAHEGWRQLPAHYDDGGFSGGSMERPGLKRLLADIEQGKIDIIVVYKVDRLTRSLTDFARIVETLDAKNVSFVSVTQQFNTTSSMGRLTLNVLLSFAQFEREVTGERIRDKIAASRRKGMWMGGFPPLGYDILNRRLAVNQVEAEQVRGIFQRFLEVKSVARLAADLKARGVHSKRWKTTKGAMQGGGAFSRGALYHLLRNRVYLGEAVHKDQVYRGEHDAIVPKDLWNRVQARLAPRENQRQQAKRHPSGALLTGLLYDDRGNLMSPSHATKRNGKRYRYYVSQAVLQYRKEDAGSLARIPAQVIEAFIEDHIKVLMPLAGKAASSGVPTADIRSTIRRVEVGGDTVIIELSMRPNPAYLRAYRDSTNGSGVIVDVSANGVILRIPVRLRSWGGEKVMDAPAALATKRTHEDHALIKALGRAHRWRGALLSGRARSLDDIAARQRCTNRYVRRVLNLSFLAPDIVDAILAGTQPRSMTVQTLLGREMPLSWPQQRITFGFAPA